MNEPGILEERILPSRSQAGKDYLMVRTAGGWQHADATCDAWAVAGHCYHVEELNMENGENTTALVLLESAEDKAIVARLSGQITRDWVYRFPVGNQEIVGLSVDGVEAAARECAKHGEAIRELDVRLEYEDEKEARFVARAGRYVVNADGAEVLLDVAIRAKRQPKVMRLRTGGTQADEFWYEKGVTKAVRNAKEALLPEAVKAEIMARAEADGRVQRVQGEAPAKRRAASRSPAHDPTPRTVYPAPAAEAESEAGGPIEGEAELAPPAGEAAVQPKNIGELFAAGRTLGYKDSATILAALGHRSKIDIVDIAGDWKKLQEMAQR